jgi:ADP-heptose:LPS heptosyltransferase
MLIGYATNDRSRLFSHVIEYSQEEYEADSFFNLLKPLNIAKPSVMPMPFLDVPASAAQKVRELLGVLIDKPFVSLFPGASIPERRWDVNKFAEVAKRLHDRGISTVVVGGGGEAASGDRIVAGTYGLNLAGKTSIAETAAIIERSKLLVSGDSGILHIGVGLGKPTVSLFGPGIAKKWAPQGNYHIVINKDLSCSPCTSFGTTPVCPIGVRCMSDISVAEVVAAIDKLMKNPALNIRGLNSDRNGEQNP